MVFIIGNEKLLINSRFHDENICWDYPLEELDHVILDTNVESDMIYVVGKDKRIYETDCKLYELNDLYKQLNQFPKLKRFELLALSVYIKTYVKYGEEAANIKFERWKTEAAQFNPNIDLIIKNYEYIIEPLKNRELKNMSFKPDNDFEKLNNIVFSMCGNDKDLSITFIEQFKDYIENTKDIEEKQNNLERFVDQEKAYITFVLAYDLLNEDFENSSYSESDVVYNKSSEIADDFLKSEFNKSTKGLYECLLDYIESERYTKFIRDKQKTEIEELEEL